MVLSIRNQLCPNNLCYFYGKPFAGNVVVHSSRARRLKCTACQRTWVAHLGEAHYRLKTSLEKVREALELLRRGWSIRRAAEQLGVSPSTVQRWKHKF